MMKSYFKKISALLMAAIMVLSMCTAVFATTKDNATITVNGADNASLSYAQVIKADKSTKTGWTFSSDAIAAIYKAAYGTSDDQATIQAVIDKGANASELKIALANIAASSDVAFTDMGTAKSLDVTEAGVYVIKAAEAGYTYNAMSAYVGFGEVVGYDYPSLIDTTVNAKKIPTTVTKTDTDADDVVAIGDIVTYKIVTNVPYINPNDTNKSFTVTDKINGAEYYLEGENSVATVTMDSTAVQASFVKDADEKGFSIDLSSLITDDNANAGKTIVVTYTAKVTAVNVDNTAGSHVGDSTYNSEQVKLYTGSITLTKYGEGNTNNVLAGAGFNVTKNGKEGNLTFAKEADGVYRYDPEGTETEVFTKADGTVEVKGLDIGIYNFTEKTAPTGYSVNENPATATLKVDGNGKATANITATTEMNDTKLGTLPSTGGMGTYLFTIIGVVIMAGAAGAFFISRKKGTEE